MQGTTTLRNSVVKARSASLLVDGTCLTDCKFVGGHPVVYGQLFIIISAVVTQHIKRVECTLTTLFLVGLMMVG